MRDKLFMGLLCVVGGLILYSVPLSNGESVALSVAGAASEHMPLNVPPGQGKLCCGDFTGFCDEFSEVCPSGLVRMECPCPSNMPVEVESLASAN